MVFFCALSGGEAVASPAGDSLRSGLARVLAAEGRGVERLAAADAVVVTCLEDLPGLKPPERVEFKSLLGELVRAALGRQVARLRGAEVKWGVEMRDGDRWVVRSVVVAEGERVDVDWVVVREADDWRLADVVTEGASMVKTWRRSFKAAYSKGGWPALAKKMRRAVERQAAGD